MTDAQANLTYRVDTIAASIHFDLAGGQPYKFHYEPKRQLLHATHFRDGIEWTTRKWFVSEHASNSEIIQTFLKLCLTSAEHEAREAFTFRGKAIYGPHLDFEKLLEIADDTEHRS